MAEIGAFLFQNKGRCRPYYFRGCENSSTNKKSLPDELVFEILLHLPAEDIYDNAMLVCRRWYRMIRTHDFVNAHRVHHSTPGLLFYDYSWYKTKYNPLVFVSMRRGKIEVSELNYKMRRSSFASCNGLILGYHLSEVALQIKNPAIKQTFNFLPFIPKKLFELRFSIAYSAVSMKYKVVLTYYEDEGRNILRCTIATVGVDKSWRDVCTRHLPPEAKNHLNICKNPIMTEGFLHWTDAKTHTHILTFDVETETFTQYPVPREQDYETSNKYYLSTGKSLSLFIFGSYLSMEVWDMKPQTGEWKKMYSIDLEPRKWRFEQFLRKEEWFIIELIPVGWLKYQEVLVLCLRYPTRVCIAYNVLTQELDFFELYSHNYISEFELHTKSLAWLT